MVTAHCGWKAAKKKSMYMLLYTYNNKSCVCMCVLIHAGKITEAQKHLGKDVKLLRKH